MLTAHLAELIGALNAFIAGFRHDSVQIAVLKHLHALNGGAAPEGASQTAGIAAGADLAPHRRMFRKVPRKLSNRPPSPSVSTGSS